MWCNWCSRPFPMVFALKQNTCSIENVQSLLNTSLADDRLTLTSPFWQSRVSTQAATWLDFLTVLFIKLCTCNVLFFASTACSVLFFVSMACSVLFFASFLWTSNQISFTSFCSPGLGGGTSSSEFSSRGGGEQTQVVSLCCSLLPSSPPSWQVYPATHFGSLSAPSASHNTRVDFQPVPRVSRNRYVLISNQARKFALF